MTYRGRGQPMEIGKSNDSFKNRKLKYFNCNKCGYIAKEYWKKKEKEMRRCFKYDKEEHIAKNYKERQSMKKWKIQEEIDNKKKDIKQGFGEDLE